MVSLRATLIVIPAQAETQNAAYPEKSALWVPAFAGMTNL
jgi:hypothetical protein